LNVIIKCGDGNLVLRTEVTHEQIETVQQERPVTLHAAAVIDEEQNAIPSGNGSETPNRLQNSVFENPEIVLAQIRNGFVFLVIDSDFHGNQRCVEFESVLVVT
jgi:hypothetical protein